MIFNLREYYRTTSVSSSYICTRYDDDTIPRQQDRGHSFLRHDATAACMKKVQYLLSGRERMLQLT